MIHKIINTGKYLLVVDPKAKVDANDPQDILSKVLAHLPLKDSEVLHGIPLLPPLEEGVWTLPIGIYVYSVGYGMFIPATGEEISVSNDWVGSYVYEGNLNEECLWTKGKIKKEGESCTLNNNCIFPKCTE
jgi:hypothetical protein